MKKISFVIILLLALGFIFYYYGQKKNISFVQKTSEQIRNFADKEFHRLQEFHPEEKDQKIPEVTTNNPVDVVGDWTLQSFVSSSQKEGSKFSPVDPSVFSLRFDTEGQVSGRTDCNGFFGSYIKEGDALRFGTLGSTMMYCPDSYETAYHEILDQVNHLAFENGMLVLSNTETGDSLSYIAQ